MKKLLAILIALCMLLGSAAFAEESSEPIAIIHTNDIHCAVNNGFGFAGVATVRDTLAALGYKTTLVDCGDAIQGEPIGTLSNGEYIIDLMNSVGYDLAIPGNHEFDYGMERFLELKDKANATYISCNFKKGDEAVLPAYKIIDYGSVKVGFVGICTPKTITSSTPKYFQDDQGNFIYNFCQDFDGTALYASVQSAVDAARTEGADYIVALGHLGITDDCSPWTSNEVIINTTGIDALLDGHSHSTIENVVKNKEGKDVVLCQTGTKLNSVGVLYIKDGKFTTSLSTWNNTVAKQVDEVMASFDELLSEVVATNEVNLTIYEPGTDPAVRIVRNAETNMGDLVADAYRIVSGADIGFVNGGGVRANINAGDVTYNDILLVNPYGNALCVVEATGQEILDALEMGCRAIPEETGGFLQVSGLTYEIHTYVPSSVKLDENGLFVKVDGEYRVKNVKVGEADLDLTKTYTLACHDYLLLNGGDGYTMFQDNVLLVDRFMLDNQVVISYIKNTLGGSIGQQYVDPHGDGRIIAVPEKP